MDAKKAGEICGKLVASQMFSLSEIVGIMKFLILYEYIVKWQRKRERRKMWLRRN